MPRAPSVAPSTKALSAPGVAMSSRTAEDRESISRSLGNRSTTTRKRWKRSGLIATSPRLDASAAFMEKNTCCLRQKASRSRPVLMSWSAISASSNSCRRDSGSFARKGERGLARGRRIPRALGRGLRRQLRLRLGLALGRGRGRDVGLGAHDFARVSKLGLGLGAHDLARVPKRLERVVVRARG